MAATDVSFPDGAAVAGIGGVLALAAVFLTWASPSVSGWDLEQGFGKMVAVLGAIAAALALLWGARPDKPMPRIRALDMNLGSAEAFLTLAGAVIMVLCLVAGFDVLNSRSCFTWTDGGTAICAHRTVEFGLWLDGLGGLLVFAGGVIGLASARTTDRSQMGRPR